jgi:hypothetical protein
MNFNIKNSRKEEKKHKEILTNQIQNPIMFNFSHISFHNASPSPNTTPDHTPVIRDSDENIQQDVIELWRSKRERTYKEYGPEYVAYTLEEDSLTLKEALSSLDVDLWKEAINDEMDSLLSNGTWHLVELPPGCKPTGCKWVLKRKLKPDGTVDKYKARFVAKVFKQKENVDFFDTYSPVTWITSIRVLIFLPTIYNLMVHQMDVKTAF